MLSVIFFYSCWKINKMKISQIFVFTVKKKILKCHLCVCKELCTLWWSTRSGFITETGIEFWNSKYISFLHSIFTFSIFKKCHLIIVSSVAIFGKMKFHCLSDNFRSTVFERHFLPQPHHAKCLKIIHIYLMNKYHLSTARRTIRNWECLLTSCQFY